MKITFMTNILFHYVNFLGEKIKVYNFTCSPCVDGYILYERDMAINMQCDWLNIDKYEYGGCSVFGEPAKKYCNTEIMNLVCKKIFD